MSRTSKSQARPVRNPKRSRRDKNHSREHARGPPPPPPPPEDYYYSDEEYDNIRHPEYEEQRSDYNDIDRPDYSKKQKEPSGRPPINVGTVLSFIGFAVIIIGIFLPLYQMSFAADIQTRTPTIDIQGEITGNETIMNYSTDGVKKLLIINGQSGIQINIPTEEGDVEPVVQSTFPYGYVYLIMIIITIALGLITKSPTKRGKRYMLSGFLALIPIFIIIILVSQMGTFIGEKELEPPLDNFVEMLSAGPIGGALPLEIDYEFESEVSPPITPPGYEDVTAKVTSQAKFHTSIIWGIDTGGLLLILGSIFLISGGITDIYLSRIYTMRISAYKEAMYRTYEDLHLSPDEANILIGLRDNLKITDKEHKRIKEELLGKG
jgi:hypothetical protein